MIGPERYEMLEVVDDDGKLDKFLDKLDRKRRVEMKVPQKNNYDSEDPDVIPRGRYTNVVE